MQNEQDLFLDVSNIVLYDRATGGKCYNCYITIKRYIELLSEVSNKSNEFQRRIINIKKSLIYQKLIRDLAKGTVIPTLSLFIDGTNEITMNTIIKPEDVQVLDGLQRTNCIMYAFNLLSRKENDKLEILKNVECISEEEFLNLPIRLEIWVDLTINGILYKMISLNAGQTPMDLDHQLEVLELPLKRELKDKFDIDVYTKDQSTIRKKEYGFNINTLVEGVIAYNTESISPRKQASAISMLDNIDINKNRTESTILKTDFVTEDLVWVISKLHKAQIDKYNIDYMESYKGILSENDVFFIPFMAALGKARRQLSSIDFNKKKESLLEATISENDPWNLMIYDEISKNIKTNIGIKRRKLVYGTFLLYFTTPINTIDWNSGNNLTV